MTFLLHQRNIFDRILKRLGKERAVYVGAVSVAVQRYGTYQTTRLSSESFVRALLRPRKATLPEGGAYPNQLIPETDRDNAEESEN